MFALKERVNKGFDPTPTEFQTLSGQISSIHQKSRIYSLKSLIQKGSLLKCLKSMKLYSDTQC